MKKIIALFFFSVLLWLGNTNCFSQVNKRGVSTYPKPQTTSADTSCNRSSTAWKNKYNKVATYLPHENSPLKTVGINLIIMQNDTGGNGFTDSEEHLKELKTLFGYVKNLYAKNGKPSDPISGVTELKSKFIDLELKGIYFYKNTALNKSANVSGLIQYLMKNDSARLQYLNVFITEAGHGLAYATRGASYDTKGNLGLVMPGIWSWSPGSDYASATEMAHEIGHIFDLCHTYLKGGCAGTLEAMGKDPDSGDWFPDVFGTPYPGNAPHTAPTKEFPWEYDVHKDTSDKVTNNLHGGFRDESYLSPLQIAKCHRALTVKNASRYVISCTYDSLNPSVITTNEDWDFSAKWEKDIFIRNKAVVNFECKISMPQKSKIVIEKGSTLIVGGTITNDCEQGWEGTIEVKRGGTLRLLSDAQIIFKGSGKIVIDKKKSKRGKVIVENGAKILLDGKTLQYK